MYVYGKNSLIEAVNSKFSIKNIYIDQKLNRDSIINICKNNGYSINLVPDNVLKKMTGTDKSQGIVFEIDDDFKYYDIDYIKKFEKPYLLILDQIQDPHNFGAIIRSALAAGVNAIIIPKDNSVLVTPTVIKVSSGQVFKIPIILVTNIARTIQYLKENDIWVYCADMDGKPYYEVDYSYPFCLVMGNEGKGIRENVKKHCDDSISIPMKNEVESLNVSVSAGIILFEGKKCRELKLK
jgi:23S rRNA (guanosine2251-2'-O)-methyltransferase